MKKIIICGLLIGALFASASFVRADTEIPLTATASSSYGSYTPDKAVDGNLSTYWRGTVSSWRSRQWWLRLDCASVQALSSITIWWYNNYGASNYDIQTSSNGSTWTTVYSGLSSTAGSTNPTYPLSGNARYVRLWINREERIFPTIYEVKIFTGAANQSPTAQAGANPTSGVAPLDVQFTGSGQDPDGTITGYSWNFGDGQTSNQQNPAHTYNTAGTYNVTLTVTDNNGATGSDSVTITVNAPPVNQPPTASAGANPTSGVAPLTVQFTGSGQDPDGYIASYFWNFGDGQTSNQQSPGHTYNNAATYTATLTVTDDDGATDSDSVQITVTEAGVQIPHLIRFQARLTNIDKVPLDGTFTLTFRLYEQVTGGSPLWQESQQGVSVQEGLVDVELGAVVALDLAFDRQYWLGIEVGSDGEMAPRFKLTTVPYSFKSEQ